MGIYFEALLTISSRFVSSGFVSGLEFRDFFRPFRWILLWTALAIPGLNTVAEPLPAETQVIIAQMAELLAQGQFDKALELFDGIDPVDAADSGIRMLKASVLCSAGRVAEGRAIAEKILAEEPDNTDALMLLSTIARAGGKSRDEKAALERLLKANPNNLKALVDLGNIALRGRSPKTAASYFDRALALEPEHLEALIGRANIHRQNQEPREAEALLNRAVSLHPREPAPFTERAKLYRRAGYPAQALEDLDSAAKLDPKDYWIAADRGAVLVELNRKGEALEEFNRALSIDDSNFFAYVYVAGIKDEMGDMDGAETAYLALTRLKPEYYFAWEGLGIIRMKKEQWAEARDAFLEAYRYAPNEWCYALLASISWMKAGKPADPRQFLDQALRKARQSPGQNSLEYLMMRLYREFAGDNDLALKIDKEKSETLKARMLFYLAAYYDIRGNKTLANKYYTDVKNLDTPGIPEWRINEWTVKTRDLAASPQGK
ncbi:MAG: tetratricopeptide repeat protein [Treponema sp.]|jgi:tetratricopeptide (TPR) repeat protein|nr:tetratricopeptide repeat protein [Treponema sp.]